ncbi:MerR family transcriptional regulator [Prescottella sp. R16]|uniref:DNA polymerase III subunit beta family protein n=1 Tax=Prescottella sp. R16 TaxID=3064529 RepID=UPI00272DFFC4|nr:MerR family transcriptional regulator [Prescottella sp. R16]
MSASGTDDLATIGAFARATGLTPSALRFYDDSGLLAPVYIDPATGYRYYSGAQRERASTIRRLRSIDVPLDAVTRILSAEPGEADRLLDEHVRYLRDRADAAAAVAASIKASRPVGEPGTSVVLPVRLFADAVRRVLPAAATDTEFPILTGILIEVGDGAVTLTATDRYRLSTRSLPAAAAGATWSVVVSAGDLAELLTQLAPAAEATVRADTDALLVGVQGREIRCPALDGEYPDYRTMLDALPPSRTRILVRRDDLLAAIEGPAEDTLRLTGTGGTLTVGAADGPSAPLIADVTGPEVALAFRRGNLLSAIVTAVGPDLMLDVAAPDLPVVIRSATDGTLTTLAMPSASDT